VHPFAEAILGGLLGLGYAGLCFGLQALSTPMFSTVMLWTAAIRSIAAAIFAAGLLPVFGMFQRWGVRFFALNPPPIDAE